MQKLDDFIFLAQGGHIIRNVVSKVDSVNDRTLAIFEFVALKSFTNLLLGASLRQSFDHQSVVLGSELTLGLLQLMFSFLGFGNKFSLEDENDHYCDQTQEFVGMIKLLKLVLVE